jgi:hypothetical protein
MSGELNMQYESDGKSEWVDLLRQRWGTSRLFRDNSGSLVQAFGKRLEVLLASLKKSLGRRINLGIGYLGYDRD